MQHENLEEAFKAAPKVHVMLERFHAYPFQFDTSGILKPGRNLVERLETVCTEGKVRSWNT